MCWQRQKEAFTAFLQRGWCVTSSWNRTANSALSFIKIGAWNWKWNFCNCVCGVCVWERESKTWSTTSLLQVCAKLGFCRQTALTAPTFVVVHLSLREESVWGIYDDHISAWAFTRQRRRLLFPVLSNLRDFRVKFGGRKRLDFNTACPSLYCFCCFKRFPCCMLKRCSRMLLLLYTVMSSALLLELPHKSNLTTDGWFI